MSEILGGKYKKVNSRVHIMGPAGDVYLMSVLRMLGYVNNSIMVVTN